MTGALILKLGVIQTKTPARGPHVIFFHNCQFSDLIGNPNLSKLAPVKNCWDSPLVKTTLKPWYPGTSLAQNPKYQVVSSELIMA